MQNRLFNDERLHSLQMARTLCPFILKLHPVQRTLTNHYICFIAKKYLLCLFQWGRRQVECMKMSARPLVHEDFSGRLIHFAVI